MSTTLARVPTSRRTRDGARPAALAGTLSAVALFVAVASVNLPRGGPDEEWLAWWGDGANRTADVVSTFSLLAAGLLFLGSSPTSSGGSARADSSSTRASPPGWRSRPGPSSWR